MKHLVMIFVVLVGLSSAYADGCYICGDGSDNGCNQCRYGSSDTRSKRKACEKKGCKITGTVPCSRKANVKVCGTWNSKRFYAAPACRLKEPVFWLATR